MRGTKSCLRTTGLLLLMFLAENATAQVDSLKVMRMDSTIGTTYLLIYKIQPLLIGEIRVSYEKVRVTKVSNEYSLGYIYKAYLKGRGSFPDFDAKKVKGISIRMSQRHYTSKEHNDPFGFFHGPLFGFRFIAFEQNALRRINPLEYAGRLYQTSVDLNYQIGAQQHLGSHLTMEVSGSLGGRVKFSKAATTEDILEDNLYGYHFLKDSDSVFSVVPLPQIKFSVGYIF
jgi:hypothetical protein